MIPRRAQPHSRRPRTRRFARGARWAALAVLLPAAAGAISVEDPGQGPVAMDVDATGASQLSGLTWAGEARYYAVSDQKGRLFPARIEIDPQTGEVRSTVLEEAVVLADARDLEGVAFTPRGTLLTSDERGPVLREHRIADGAVVAELAVPAIFRRARLNLSLESLALGPDGELWTANEEALQVDGATSSNAAGTRVRLQRFAPDGAPGGQWAYLTDPWPGEPVAGLESSGVVDLVCPAAGELLVLERSFSNQGFRARLYAVDFEGATDTSELPSLESEGTIPVEKRLLWERNALTLNFEGAALGTRLADGARSLILISDDAGLTVPHLYALRLRLEPPKPTPAPPETP